MGERGNWRESSIEFVEIERGFAFDIRQRTRLGRKAARACGNLGTKRLCLSKINGAVFGTAPLQ